MKQKGSAKERRVRDGKGRVALSLKRVALPLGGS